MKRSAALLAVILMLTGCATKPKAAPPRFHGRNLVAEKAFVFGIKAGLEMAEESQTNRNINFLRRGYEIKNTLVQTLDTNGVFNGLDFKTNSWTF